MKKEKRSCNKQNGGHVDDVDDVDDVDEVTSSSSALDAFSHFCNRGHDGSYSSRLKQAEVFKQKSGVFNKSFMLISY